MCSPHGISQRQLALSATKCLLCWSNPEPEPEPETELPLKSCL